MRVVGFAGYSGAGKTTLIEQLIPWFVQRGLKVSLIKHAHHRFDIDQPGKDSWRHREAGATEVLITSSQRWVLMHELRGSAEPGLFEQLNRFADCDLVLVEGYKQARIAKLEVHRGALGQPLLFPQDPDIVALVTDATVTAELPVLDLNAPATVAQYIFDHLDDYHEHIPAEL